MNQRIYDPATIEFLEEGKTDQERLTLVFQGEMGFKENQSERRGIIEVVRGLPK